MKKSMKKIAKILLVASLITSMNTEIVVTAQDIIMTTEEDNVEASTEVFAEEMDQVENCESEEESEDIIEIISDESDSEQSELIIDQDENTTEFEVQDTSKEGVVVISKEENGYIEPDWEIAYERTVQIAVGQKKELQIEVTGTTERLKYQWFEDGEKIEGATESRYTVSADMIFENGWNSKEYRCDITDSNGKYRQAFVTVSASTNYGTLECKPVGNRELSVKPGKTLELGIYASTTTNNKISYVWKREIDGNESIISGANTDTYKKVMEISDQGEYSCKVSDGKSTEIITFVVSVDCGVQYKEKVILEVPYGRSVTLKQDATTEVGTLGYIWREWDGNGVGEGKNYITEPITKNTTYYCEFYVWKDGKTFGENLENGNFETEFEIRVVSDWNIEAPEKVAVGEDGRATLSVQVTGTDKEHLTYEWENVSSGLDDILGNTQTYKTDKIDGVEVFRCTVCDQFNNRKSLLIIVGKKEILSTISKDYESAVVMSNSSRMIEFAIVDLANNASEYNGAYIRFTPDKTGYWNFTMKDRENSWNVSFLNTDKKVLSYVVGVEDNKIELYLTKGKTYYIRLCSPYGNAISINRMVARYTGAEEWEQHIFKTESVSKKATCTESGEKTVYCTKCFLHKVVEMPTSGKHEFGNWTVSKKATCTVNGIQYKICGVCGKKEEKQIPKMGHKFGSYVVTKRPTLTAQGTRTRICSNCGKKETVSIAKITQNIPLQTGKSLELNKMVTGKVKSCISYNTKVAGVLNKEKVTGKAAGTAVLEMQLANGSYKYVQITVQKNAVKTSKITDVPTSVKLNIGQSKRLVPVLNPVTSSEKITYTSSNKKIATVSGSGVITAKKSGNVKITVKAGSKTVTVTVTVAKKAPTGISGVPASKILKKGKSFTIKGNLTPIGAEGKITYQSSNKGVATVDSKGNVKAKKAGTAIITVSCGKLKRTCKITVK